MKKYIITVCTLLMCFYSIITAHGMYDTLNFQCEMIRPSKGQKGSPKAPIKCPSASIEGHTLYINDCDGCMLQLLGENGIVYSTIIVDGIAELPEDLTGIYELQIIRGNYCFWTEVEL